jgi:hypothetical protein
MARKVLVELLCKDMLADLATFEPAASAARCPLCLETFVMDDKSPRRPTAEHIIQSSLGGTLEYATATCVGCNNRRGSNVEGDLKNAMSVLDFMDGNGTLPMTLANNVGRVSGNVIANGSKPITIDVLGPKASNMQAVEAMRGNIREDGKLGFTLNYGFRGEAYRRAVLRIGYLAAFKYFGYVYALSEAGAMARAAMASKNPPDGVIMETYPSVEPPLRFFAQQATDFPGILAIFKLRGTSTRWLAVLLPGQIVSSWESLRAVAENARQMQATITFEKFGLSTTIGFDRDPIQRLLEIRVPADSPAARN